MLSFWQYTKRRSAIKKALLEFFGDGDTTSDEDTWYVRCSQQDEVPATVAFALCWIAANNSVFLEYKTDMLSPEQAVIMTHFYSLLGQPTSQRELRVMQRRVHRLLFALIRRGVVVVTPALGEFERVPGQRPQLQFGVYVASR